jgi:hypothetical protein
MNVAELSVDHVPAMLRAGVSGALGVCAGAEGVVGLEQASERPPAMRTKLRITTRGPKPCTTSHLAVRYRSNVRRSVPGREATSIEVHS